MPSVSVLMTAFNSEKYIERAIDSVLSQSFEDFEFIIINDGSQDMTEAKILGYQDPRIVYIKNEKNLGIALNSNKGIEIAQGDYIARMDSDDIAEPERLLMQYDLMERNKSIGVCGAWFEYINDADKTIKIQRLPTDHCMIKIGLIYYCPIAHPVSFIRKSVLKRNNENYEERYPSAHDYALWVNLMRQRVLFTNIPKVLLRYRKHSTQISHVLKISQDRERNEISIGHISNLNCLFSEGEKDIYTKFVFDKVSGKGEELKQLRSLIRLLLRKNKRSRYFDRHLFEEFVQEHLDSQLDNLVYFNPYLSLLLFTQFGIYQTLRNRRLLKIAVKGFLFWKSSLS